MGYFVELPPSAAERYLKPNERFECRNASIIVNEKGEFCGWIDNDAVVCVYCDGEE